MCVSRIELESAADKAGARDSTFYDHAIHHDAERTRPLYSRHTLIVFMPSGYFCALTRFGLELDKNRGPSSGPKHRVWRWVATPSTRPRSVEAAQLRSPHWPADASPVSPVGCFSASAAPSVRLRPDRRTPTATNRSAIEGAPHRPSADRQAPRADTTHTGRTRERPVTGRACSPLATESAALVTFTSARPPRTSGGPPGLSVTAALPDPREIASIAHIAIEGELATLFHNGWFGFAGEDVYELALAFRLVAYSDRRRPATRGRAGLRLPNRLLTAYEVAKFVGCHEETVRRAYLRGLLVSQRFRIRGRRFHPNDVLDWIRRGAPTRPS